MNYNCWKPFKIRLFHSRDWINVELLSKYMKKLDRETGFEPATFALAQR
jgi:hypothetical protein